MNFQDEVGRTLSGPDIPLTISEHVIVWFTLALAGEAGEVVERVKKGIFHQHGLDVAGIKEELGDVMWCVAALCTRLGLDLEDVMAENIKKQRERYPDGYSSEASKNRKR